MTVDGSGRNVHGVLKVGNQPSGWIGNLGTPDFVTGTGSKTPSGIEDPLDL